MDKFDMSDVNQPLNEGQTSSESASSPTEKKKSWLRGVFRFVKKHVIVVLCLLLAIAALATLQVLNLNREAAWKRATDYYARAEYEKASKELASLSMPSSAERLRVYGQTMLATRQLDKSLEAYTKLYDLNKDPSVKIIIGNIYNEQKKYDESIKIYREVISANPNNVQAFVNMATVYKLQNNEKEAAKIAKEGVEKNPNSVVLLELRVSMLMSDKSSPEYKEAVEALKQVNPQDQLLQALNEV